MRRNSRSGMSRRRFLGTAGAAGMAGAAMYGSGVASAAKGGKPLYPQGTLGAIKKRGWLNVVVAPENFPGLFVGYDENGDQLPVSQCTGIDADLAFGLAAAIFGPTNIYDKVRFVNPGDYPKRTQMIRTGKADVGFALATANLERDTDEKVNFGPVYIYQGQDILSILTKEELYSDPSTEKYHLGAPAGTTSETNVINWLAAEGLTWVEVVTAETLGELLGLYESGSLDAITGDAFILLSIKNALGLGGDLILKDTPLSKEPIAPFYAEGDDNWADIIRWYMFALFQAEEYGPDLPPDFGEGVAGQLGLSDPNWAHNVLDVIGDYKEVFEQNFPDSYWYKDFATKDRGLNNLWTHPTTRGLHYPWPGL